MGRQETPKEAMARLQAAGQSAAEAVARLQEENAQLVEDKAALVSQIDRLIDRLNKEVAIWRKPPAAYVLNHTPAPPPEPAALETLAVQLYETAARSRARSPWADISVDGREQFRTLARRMVEEQR